MRLERLHLNLFCNHTLSQRKAFTLPIPLIIKSVNTLLTKYQLNTRYPSSMKAIIHAANNNT